MDKEELDRYILSFLISLFILGAIILIICIIVMIINLFK